MSKDLMSKDLMSEDLYEDAWIRAEQAVDQLLLEVRSSEHESPAKVHLLLRARWFIIEASEACEP